MALMRKPRRFTLEEYHRMGEAGILDEDERVELIEGEIVEMSPIGPLHGSVVARLVSLLVRQLGDRAIVWPQNSLVLRAVVSQLQPDLALLRPRADYYRSANPEPRDVLLVIEVVDSSVDRDRRVKLYALRAGRPRRGLAGGRGRRHRASWGPCSTRSPSRPPRHGARAVGRRMAVR